MVGAAVFFLASEYKRSRDKYRLAGQAAFPPARELLWYRVDYWLSSTSKAKPIALLFATYLLIFLGAVLIVVVNGADFSSALWESWTFVADPGTHAEQQGSLSRLVAFSLTIGGMLIFALMIGIIADSVSEYLDNLKQGKSRVVESQHTLILGWSDTVLPTIQELCVANESEGGGVIVVMADRDKEEMEGEIGSASLRLLGSVVVCRSGRPILMNDLRRVSAETARAVIVVADKAVAPDESDAKAVRVVLSLSGLRIRGHAVVELCDVDNRPLVGLVANQKVETVVAHDMIGRSMLQCSRQPGLSHILMAVMGFTGDEFYFQHWPSLTGHTFRSALFRFPQAVPLGVRRASPAHSDQPVVLNPPDTYVMQPGDELLVLAEDDDSYAPADDDDAWVPQQITLPAECTAAHHGPPAVAENVLFCGWRRDVDDMIVELDKAVAPGSQLVLMSTLSIEEREEVLRDGGLEVASLRNIHLIHVEGNSVSRRCLEQLPVPLCDFSSVLILADQQEEMDMQTADSRSLACLLLIRDILAKRSFQPVPFSQLVSQPSAGASAGAPRQSGRASSIVLAPSPVPGSDGHGGNGSGVGSGGVGGGGGGGGAGSPPPLLGDSDLESVSSSSSSSSSSEAEEEEGEGGETKKESDTASSLLSSEPLPPVPTRRRRSSVRVRLSHLSPTNTPAGVLLSHSLKQAVSIRSADAAAAALVNSRTQPQQPQQPPPPMTADEAALAAAAAAATAAAPSPVLICEILDSRTRGLIAVAKISDYVMSNEIVSCAMSMVAERREVNAVLNELLGFDGQEFHLRPARLYTRPCPDDGAPTRLCFYQIMERARARGEIAIGYQVAGETEVLNPRDKRQPREWAPSDMVVVLAED